ncbi:hypothetical protein JOQ06_009154 [Pogonophryne albipinna]|uniref:Uncharacterized protein n=1 Tax=Pogonophryne albipinna TaxID=1090488 RepID=A0AAD6FT87_9TELE|nr:hypothetical protein JOQ06_009154 [Pogonophryne albipinna]
MKGVPPWDSSKAILGNVGKPRQQKWVKQTEGTWCTETLNDDNISPGDHHRLMRHHRLMTHNSDIFTSSRKKPAHCYRTMISSRDFEDILEQPLAANLGD